MGDLGFWSNQYIIYKGTGARANKGVKKGREMMIIFRYWTDIGLKTDRHWTDIGPIME